MVKKLESAAEAMSAAVDAALETTAAVGAPSTPPTRTRRSAIIRIGALAVLLIALTVFGYRLGWFDAKRIIDMIQRLQSGRDETWVVVGLVLIYTAATAIGFPSLPLTVAGGALFGHLFGSALSWAAAVAGSVLGYWLARGIGREAARRWLSKRKVGEAFTESTGFFTLLYLRLVPVVPLSVVNFTAGLARMRVTPFVAATAIGVLPTTIVFAYFADSLVRGLEGAKTHAYGDIAIASSLLMVLSLVPLAVKRWRARH